jgi:hypothetical protein
MLLGGLVSISLPFAVSALVSEYADYANDFGTITILLVVPILLAESLLTIVLVLLRRIRADRMFSISAQGWVRALAYNAGALSVSFALILAWLNIKNTLPPIVGLVLLIGIVAPLAVSLVTRSLLVLLKRATSASEELQGVV